MKKSLIYLIFVILTYTASTQNVIDSIRVVKTIDEVANFKLFPTVNMWTFLKLDTRNGKIWQIQWSLENSKRFETVLSFFPLVLKEEEVKGRFTLYPTTNNYNFILLDQISGKTYQVQWSQEANNRGILEIN